VIGHYGCLGRSFEKCRFNVGIDTLRAEAWDRQTFLANCSHSGSSGFEAGLIVYDSPVKTQTELIEAVQLGLHMNLDNEGEIGILDPLLRDQKIAGIVGLRINPVVGAGQIAMISTATPQSKFGLPLTTETRESVAGTNTK
jgi:diaminopimelate decarboxylase